MKRKLVIASTLLSVAILGTIFASYIPGFANGYFNVVYRPITTVFAFIFGLVHTSVVELLLYAGIAYVIFLIGRYIVRRITHKQPRRKRKGKEAALQIGTNVALVFSILFFLFVMNCGMNYHRISFAELEGFQSKKYTTDQVLKACNILTKEINDIQSQIPRNKSGEILLEGGSGARARKAMENLGTTYKSLSGYYPLPKPLLNSSILSYQDTSGIYSPFTVEANYNDDMPEYLKGYTMCHELSHLKGVMREEEANFVAFLACDKSEDAVIRYSGLMHAYRCCMEELYNRDKESFLSLRKKLNEHSDQDIKTRQQFWQKYDTVIAKLSSKVNDSYLKANAQTQGVDSYDAVTGYIVEYYQKR